ncbi:MAG: AraC family transcriptional regulator [Spirochaetes bacterium]|nr:AraC family transcriptional regulator [Spirochaetota bacterium]
MNYIKRVQNAIDYIENNLSETLDLNDIAGVAGCSLFHFHRIFQATSGYTLKEYIRKRRLAEAAQELRSNKRGILDLALDYGYESQEAFTRAFQKETGRTPGEFRKTRSSFRSFTSLDINLLKNKGDTNMIEAKIVEKESFLVIGPAIRATSEQEENFKKIPVFWTECLKNKVLETIPNTIKNNACYGICLDPKSNEFTYMIAAQVSTLEEIPDNMIGREIPGGKYAVFTAKGPATQAVQDLTRYIYGEWISGSGYSLAERPDFELYDERSNYGDDSEVDIYIPVK